MYSIPEVNFEEITGRDGNLGLITLNRPQVLNALNQPMFQAVYNQLGEWEAASQIKGVIIRAADGRAFCAGGDIRDAYARKKNDDPGITDFFRIEYRMNQRIHHFSKPYIALMDGITMGGGVGISAHGSHRVGTDRMIFSMPETGIGFYPDVGATYLLSRLPQHMGFYLGLTGARINENDCYDMGLLEHIVKQGVFQEIIFALADASFADDANATVTDVLNKFSIPAKESDVWQKRSVIETCFSKKNVEDILLALKNEKDTWYHQVAADMETKSPTSLKVTLKALQMAEKLDFDDCMQMEFRLTTRFLQGNEFFEGIRAAVIDKDRQPKWQPSTLGAVSTQEIKKFFEPLQQELV